MREIRFRGQTQNRNRWVFGDLIHFFVGDIGKQIIIENDKGDRYIIAPETVGQYTGLKDKNGTKIFEGDIVKVSDFEGGHRIGKVVWNDNACCYRIDGHLFDFGLGIYRFGDIKVIGNIYDNPELFEEKEE